MTGRKTRKDKPARVRKPKPQASSPLVTTVVTEADPEGCPVTHHRTVDTLGIMLKAGSITDPMFNAARDFQAAFTIAGLETLKSLPLLRIPGQGRPADPSDARLAAKRRVAEALDSLGGMGSPAASIVWHVVGLQSSIREWSLRQGWGGRPVHQQQAQGILVAALGVLAKHTGTERRHARMSSVHDSTRHESA